MRAAIYARMSTDKQSADSPADQIARCREFAARRGFVVVDALVMVDAGISGASRHDRPGLLSIMERIGEWDALLCFDASRLARDEEDFGWILNQLEEHGRTGFEASTGQDLSSFGTRIMGVVNAEERPKIKVNTHRGLAGRIDRKLAAGAAPFGYRTERIGEGQGARIVVVPADADVVRRIFQLYASGDGIKAIAKRLNAEGIPSPRPRALKHRPRSWSPTAIREMLRNELYRGDLLWNRSHWVKPRKGPRRRVARPESEWKRQHDEAWRIVEDGLWAAVQERAAARAAAMRPSARSRTGLVAAGGERSPRARHLLAGLLACAECGGAVCALEGGGVFGCSWHRDRGPSVCGNTMRIRAEALEPRVFGMFEAQALAPSVVAFVIERTLEIVRERLDVSGLAAKRTRVAEVTREIERLIDMATQVDEGLTEIAGRINGFHRERVALNAALRASEIELDVDSLRPLIEARLADLRTALSGRQPERSHAALRELLRGERLRVGPDPERGFRVEGTAWLSVALEERGARNPQDSGRLTRQVAGDRYTPVASICRSRSQPSPGRSAGSPSAAVPAA